MTLAWQTSSPTSAKIRSYVQGRSSDFPSCSAAFPLHSNEAVALWQSRCSLYPTGLLPAVGYARKGLQRRDRPRLSRGSLLSRNGTLALFYSPNRLGCQALFRLKRLISPYSASFILDRQSCHRIFGFKSPVKRFPVFFHYLFSLLDNVMAMMIYAYMFIC